jgi:hypothetical protein
MQWRRLGTARRTQKEQRLASFQRLTTGNMSCPTAANHCPRCASLPQQTSAAPFKRGIWIHALAFRLFAHTRGMQHHTLGGAVPSLDSEKTAAARNGAHVGVGQHADIAFHEDLLRLAQCEQGKLLPHAVARHRRHADVQIDAPAAA